MTLAQAEEVATSAVNGLMMVHQAVTDDALRAA